MTYFNSTTDAILRSQIASILPKQYCKHTEIEYLPVLPLTPLRIKAIKIESPTCFSYDVDSDTAGMFMLGPVTIPNAAMSGSVKAILSKIPDPDVIDKICRMYLYLYMGDSPNAMSMITEISNETKNVLLENNNSIRKQPVRYTQVVPWEL
ncbi:MAG TPA: hypothetical protein PKI15_08665 [Candidatus Cloacimonadota bacterium]|nr:hypothetical protein [Candidatus Cloacimonadota bacterium]